MAFDNRNISHLGSAIVAEYPTALFAVSADCPSDAVLQMLPATPIFYGITLSPVNASPFAGFCSEMDKRGTAIRAALTFAAVLMLVLATLGRRGVGDAVRNTTPDTPAAPNRSL